MNFVLKSPFIVLLSFLFVSSSEAQIKAVLVSDKLDNPIDIEDADDGPVRLFFVLQTGKILVYNGKNVLSTPFLNISKEIACCGEQGLLSLAFHPHYKSNRIFFIYYVNSNGNLVLAAYQVSADQNVADAKSRKILLTIPHPAHSNHNGGEIQFGKDGYLYLSVGDGGGAGDQSNNAQDLGRFLGKILRIDVDHGSPYSIPPDNPFVINAGAKKEIWAYGLRNPWRYSFDRKKGRMYIGDVGQNAWEEIDIQPRRNPGGVNYGWRNMEGSHCFNPATNCNKGFRLPIIEYSHNAGCAVTGGYLYRGRKIPELYRTYLFADYCSGTIWGAKKSSGHWNTFELLNTSFNISTFGQDRDGELYFANHADSSGAVYKIVKD
jgi:glucose/arabinose dehydrogenase